MTGFNYLDSYVNIGSSVTDTAITNERRDMSQTECIRLIRQGRTVLYGLTNLGRVFVVPRGNSKWMRLPHPTEGDALATTIEFCDIDARDDVVMAADKKNCIFEWSPGRSSWDMVVKFDPDSIIVRID